MTRSPHLLLKLLAAAAALCLAGSVCFIQLDRLQAAESQVRMLQRAAGSLRRPVPSTPEELRDAIENLRRAEVAELQRYYRGDEMDPYRLASLVTDALDRHGLSVDRLRTVPRPAAAALEIGLRGPARGLVAFLREVASQPRYWPIPYLHVTSREDGNLECELQVGILVHERALGGPNGVGRVPRSRVDPRDPGVVDVARLFGRRSVDVPRGAGPPTQPPEKAPWLHYVAYVVARGGEVTYFFKNDRSGSILMLSPRRLRDGWTLLELRDGTFVIGNHEHLYQVPGGPP